MARQMRQERPGSGRGLPVRLPASLASFTRAHPGAQRAAGRLPHRRRVRADRIGIRPRHPAPIVSRRRV
jgi:hypothetical protein